MNDPNRSAGERRPQRKRRESQLRAEAGRLIVRMRDENENSFEMVCG